MEFCSRLLTLEDGRPLVLYAAQREMLVDFFNGAVETLILVPKKNGKSTLLGALALFHLVTTPDAECVIAAASRDQASIMLRQARGFIRRQPALQAMLVVKQREIVSLRDGGRIRILASDVDTADGVIPTLALVDELHRHKSADLYGVFRDGLGPRNGQMITISTAGDDEASPLGLIREKAYAMPSLSREGAHRYARSEDLSVVMHEWALAPDEDRNDLELVKRANPAPWQTVEELRRRRDSPSMTAWQWARFACGVWLQGEDRVVNPVEWAECGSDIELRPPEGAIVRIGLDLGWTGDTTAAVPHWFAESVACLGVPKILEPPRDGGLRKSAILTAVEELRADYGANVVVLDPEAGGAVVGQDLEELGFTVASYSQKPGPMADAAEEFYTAVRERALRHPKDPRLTRHVLNAKKRGTDDGRWRFVKEDKQSRKHIDALIAAAIVHRVAVAERDAPDRVPLMAFV